MSSPPLPRLFDDDDLVALSAPHVGRAFFVMLDLPSGISRLHNGVGLSRSVAMNGVVLQTLSAVAWQTYLRLRIHSSELHQPYR